MSEKYENGASIDNDNRVSREQEESVDEVNGESESDNSASRAQRLLHECMKENGKKSRRLVLINYQSAYCGKSRITHRERSKGCAAQRGYITFVVDTVI